MSTRNNILNTLKTELQDNVNIGNGYNCDIAEVRRGVHLNDNFPLKPAISFFCYKDSIEEHLQGITKIRKLNIYLYGFADTDGLGNVDNIYDLADDIENFLDSTNFTYTNDTYLGDIDIYEGGEEDPVSLFTLELDIVYRI